MATVNYRTPPLTIASMQGSTIEWIEIIAWVLEALKVLLNALAPIHNIDAKMAYLIGNHASKILTLPPGFEWLGPLITATATIQQNPLDEGIFGRKEIFPDTSYNWVTFQESFESLMYWIARSMRFVPYMTAPFVAEAPSGNIPDQPNRLAFTEIQPGEGTINLLSDTGEKDLLHLIAQLTQMFSANNKIPLPSFNQYTIDKQTAGDGTTWGGTIADIELAKEEELFSRLQQFRYSTLAQPAG